MLATGRSVFRPRLHSSLPVAAFSTAADLAATQDGPAEEAPARAGVATPSAADAASAVPATKPPPRMGSRPLVPMTLPLDSRRTTGAGRALPRPRAEGEFREQVPARTTGFRAGIPAADHDQVPPGPGCLVLDHAAEGAPPAVGNGFGQRPVADHVLHGQVLEHDHVMVADQPGRGTVQVISACGADFAVSAGYL